MWSLFCTQQSGHLTCKHIQTDEHTKPNEKICANHNLKNNLCFKEYITDRFEFHNTCLKRLKTK